MKMSRGVTPEKLLGAILVELEKMTALLNEIHIDIHELADAQIPRQDRPVETLAEGEGT